MEKTYVKNAVIAIATLLSLFLLVISIKGIKEIGYVGKDTQASNIISVTGTGDAIAIPDLATFTFGITEEASTVSEAQTKATTKINAAIKIVKDSGVADKDIKTQGYNIYPIYSSTNSICTRTACPPVKQMITGYSVNQMIEVKVRDTSKAGKLLNDIGATGINNVSGLSFSVDKEEALKDSARNLAITQAREKAEVLAKQLGVKLVRIVSFNENNGGGYPVMYKSYDRMEAAANSGAMAPQVEVPSGEQKITSTVTITYEIK